MLNLSKKYDLILYAALYSFVSEEVGSAIFPSDNLYRILPTEKKRIIFEKVVHHISKDMNQRRTLKKIAYWCALSSFFETLLEYDVITEESILGTMFSVPSTTDIFKDYTRGHPISRLTREYIGATLSSDERAQIYSAVLNRISGLNEKVQLRYLSAILKGSIR